MPVIKLHAHDLRRRRPGSRMEDELRAGVKRRIIDMGADPKRSALNRFNQMHEVKNLFVVDGSAFPNATEKNPTLTILALSWRATDYLAEQIKRGDL